MLNEEPKLYWNRARLIAKLYKLQLIATIANSYYTLLMLDEQLDISKRTAENWAEKSKGYESFKKSRTIHRDGSSTDRSK